MKRYSFKILLDGKSSFSLTKWDNCTIEDAIKYVENKVTFVVGDLRNFKNVEIHEVCDDDLNHDLIAKHYIEFNANGTHEWKTK